MSKKGQEEIIGFVAIILVVSVIFLIFIGISLRLDSKKSNTDSVEAYQFLESIGHYTSDCRHSEVGRYSGNELIKECYFNRDCLGGESACEELNKTISKIINDSYMVSEEGDIKGLIFKSVYVNDENEELVLHIENGACEGSLRGSSSIVSVLPGKIINTFEICI